MFVYTVCVSHVCVSGSVCVHVCVYTHVHLSVCICVLMHVVARYSTWVPFFRGHLLYSVPCWPGAHRLGSSGQPASPRVCFSLLRSAGVGELHGLPCVHSGTEARSLGLHSKPFAA